MTKASPQTESQLISSLGWITQPEKEEKEVESHCVGYFSCDCKQIFDRKQLKEGRLYSGSQLDSAAHHDGEGMAAGM